MIESLISYIADRANDPIHKEHRQIIADFISSFCVTELKGRSSVDQKQVQTYQKPAQEPPRQPKTVRVPYGACNDHKATTKFQDRIVRFTPVLPPNNPQPTKDPTPKPRTGNGHVSKKVRKLTDMEKNMIRAHFRYKNGIFQEDDLVRFRQKYLDPEVSIFQVTGFVTLVHKDIAAGRFSVPNMKAYMDWMRKQRRLWNRYQSPKYRRLREKNLSGSIGLAGIV